MSDDKRYERTIHLYDDINRDSIKKVIEKIIDINDKDDKDSSNLKEYTRQPIKLYINTCGGSVVDCFALISTIKGSETPIHGYVSGYSFSCGFLIFISCHKRFMGEYANLMYHQLSAGTWGKFQDLNEYQEHLNYYMNRFHNLIVKNSVITKEELIDCDNHKKDWYFDSEEAIKYGLVDEIF